MNMKITQMIADKMSQWDNEALLFCAAHGAKGGVFEAQVWANGKTMVGPPGCRSNQAIPESAFVLLQGLNWKVYSMLEGGIYE